MTHTNVGKIILNLGALTITEVTTATGKQGYRVQSRERKLLTKAQLPKVRYILDREIRGERKRQTQRRWKEKNRELCNAKLRKWRRENRDRLNARKRELYALKKSMR